MWAFQGGCVKSELVRERKREYKCITCSGFSGYKPIFYKKKINFLVHLEIIWRLCPTKVTQQSGDLQRCTILSSLCNNEGNYEMFNSDNCWGLQTFDDQVDYCSADQLCFERRPWRFIRISSLFLLSFLGEARQMEEFSAEKYTQIPETRRERKQRMPITSYSITFLIKYVGRYIQI